MKIARIISYALALTVFTLIVLRAAPFYPTNPFPERKALRQTIYQPPVMPWNTNGPSAWRSADKKTTDDYQQYIRDEKITSIIVIYLYQDAYQDAKGWHADTNGWHAIQITELKEPKSYVEHLLEYDKSDTRIKTRKVPWKDHAW